MSDFEDSVKEYKHFVRNLVLPNIVEQVYGLRDEISDQIDSLKDNDGGYPENAVKTLEEVSEELCSDGYLEGLVDRYWETLLECHDSEDAFKDTIHYLTVMSKIDKINSEFGKKSYDMFESLAKRTEQKNESTVFEA